MAVLDLEPPRYLGPYELITKLGVGGMGAVFLARKRVVGDTHRLVAIKLMHPSFSESADAAAELMAEAQIAASIRHPHVVPVLDANEEGDTVFLAMDYVEGENLGTLIRKAAKADMPLALNVATRIVCDALAGLHAAHEHEGLSIVHRDFSPQNILVGVDGLSRLSDFGIARASNRAARTATGMAKGKIGYMSPEQAQGLPLDRRSDVFAAGVVLWEACTGRRLFREANEVATAMKIIDGDRVERASTYRKDVPEALDEAISWALERDPDARCPTAAELRQRIVAAANSWGGTADSERVAEVVEQWGHEALSMRRAAVDRLEAISRSGVVAVSSEEDEGTTVQRGVVSQKRARIDDDQAKPDAEKIADVTRTANVVDVHRSRRNRTAPWLLVAALAAGGVAWALQPVDPADVEAQPALAGTPSPASSPKAQPTAPSPPATIAPLDRATLEVTGDAPLAQLIINGRSVALAIKTKETTVALLPTEQTAVLEVVAVTSDGRRARGSVALERRTLVLSFPAPTQARPRAPVPKLPPAPRTPKGELESWGSGR